MKKILIPVSLFILFALLTAYNGSIITNQANPIPGVSTQTNNDTTKFINYFEIDVTSFSKPFHVKEFVSLHDSSEKITLSWQPARIKGAIRPDDDTPVYLSDHFKINGIFNKTSKVGMEYTFSADSSEIYVRFNDPVNKEIIIDYEIMPDVLLEDFGKASGKNFYFFTDWYAVLKDYSSYSGDARKIRFGGEIRLPNSTQFGTNLMVTDTLKGEKNRYRFFGDQASEFVWFAGDNMTTKSMKCSCKGKTLSVETYFQNEKNNYSGRIDSSISAGLIFLEKYIDDFPYSKLLIVDLPRTFYSNKTFPGLIPIKTNLISPVEKGEPEFAIFEGMSRQYFGFSKLPEYFYEPYIYHGLNFYLSELIYHENFGEPDNYFQFADFYPISGLQFLAYNHIPIMYTLGDYKLERGARSLSGYYENIYTSAVDEAAGSDASVQDFLIRTRQKAALAFLSLEKSIGKDETLSLLQDFYRENTGENFAEFLEKRLTATGISDETSSLVNLFTGSKFYDYSLKSVEKIGQNEYQLIIERLGDGEFPVDIAVYTEEDTLNFGWNGKERFYKFKFNSNNEVIAAELDPQRKNMLDINFTNNSYTISAGYGGAWSVSTRWFFWIQNALMILGSIG